MNTRWKVALGLSELTDTQTIEKAREIVSAMGGLAYFPDPDPPLAQLTAQANTTEQAYLASRDAGKDETATFHNELDELERMMLMEANYVENQANKQPEIGDQIILAAAMGVKAPPTRNVQDFSVENAAAKGDVDANMKAQGPRTIYLWFYREKGDTEWIRAAETMQSNYTYTGLTSGMTYDFRGGYVTTENETIYFDPIELVIL